uniref:Uncharacterized protein n=1 Tax=Solanum tuberosum TaxID=4113 RepID=M1C9E7_SOLTU
MYGIKIDSYTCYSCLLQGQFLICTLAMFLYVRKQKKRSGKMLQVSLGGVKKMGFYPSASTRAYLLVMAQVLVNLTS